MVNLKLDSKETIEKIRQALTEEFQPFLLEIIDESHHHAGHAGAKGGGGHFFVRIGSTKFVGISSLGRQRLVYAALGALMEREIHALSMKCSDS